MRTFISKIFIASFTVGSILTLSACDNIEAKTNKTSAKTETATSHAENAFSCPMHPEVTGKEGDTCPKCGMKLEHIDYISGNSSVKMNFITSPKTVKANQEVTLSLIPRLEDNDKRQVPLEVEHEKKIHLIVVNDDLSYFDHIHPAMNADGSYTVKHTFPAGGNYILFADYKPAGHTHSVDKLHLTVTGDIPEATHYRSEKLVSNVDGFIVKLNADSGRFVSNSPMHIVASLSKHGKTIDPNTLQNYLGSKAHMVIVSVNEKNYTHVHPNVKDGKFDLHTTFEKSGIYKGWMQFQTNGKIHTADFIINVK